jgi:hypothetical protein
MRDRLLALFARWRALQEIEVMSERDLADLGMTRDQILDFASAPADTEQRMAAMARIFGLSMDELRREYATYLDMVQTCGHCSARRQCSDTLAHAAQAHPEDCGFCPNARDYADRAAMKSVRAA